MSLDYRLAGRRVRLINTTDQWTDLKPGAEGTVNFTDDVGTLHVHWDSGSHLGLVCCEDRWELLPNPQGEQQ